MTSHRSPIRRNAAIGPGAKLTGGILQRKCACGQHTIAGSGCEECKKDKENGTLQRHSTGTFNPGIAAPIVHEVLSSPGQPLEPGTRAIMERRFGQDFSGVRVHANTRAADSAKAVNALAYTVGNNVVFGAGRYAPSTNSGTWLLAHELAHTIQQKSAQLWSPDAFSIDSESSRSERAADSAAEAVLAGRTVPSVGRSGTHLQRQSSRNADPSNRPLPPHKPSPHLAGTGVCYGSAVCKDLVTPTKLLSKAESNPANEAKRSQRERACTKKPPDPACTADGHGSPARQTTKLLHDYDAALPAQGVKIIVDNDLESDFRAARGSCKKFMPPIPDSRDCIAVPAETEKQADQFNNTINPTIAGEERGKWRERMLEVLVHESEHARFRNAVESGRLLADEPSCANTDTWLAMNELAAMLTEFRLRMERIRTRVGLTPEQREEELNEWRDHRIKGKEQSVTVSLRTARCACNCDDANKMIRETIEFAIASWTPQEKNELHREMRDPQWKDLDLQWPFIAPPLPTVERPTGRN